MNFKKWVKSIQTAGYNGARTVNRSYINASFRPILETNYMSVTTENEADKWRCRNLQRLKTNNKNKK